MVPLLSLGQEIQVRGPLSIRFGRCACDSGRGSFVFLPLPFFLVLALFFFVSFPGPGGELFALFVSD